MLNPQKILIIEITNELDDGPLIRTYNDQIIDGAITGYAYRWKNKIKIHIDGKKFPEWKCKEDWSRRLTELFHLCEPPNVTVLFTQVYISMPVKHLTIEYATDRLAEERSP